MTRWNLYEKELMRKYRLITSFAMLLAVSPISAQRLAVIKGTVECGNVEYNNPVKAVFELKNKGFRRLRLEDVRTSCGCTMVEYPKEDISAGDKFTITMTYDARQLGHFEKLVRIVSNADKQPVYLTMKGIVCEDVVNVHEYPFALGDLAADKNDIEFDDVNKGDKPRQVIHIRNTGTKVLEPNMMHLPPYLSASVSPQYLRPGQTGNVEVTLNSEKLRDYGLTQTSIYLGNQLGEKVSDDNEVTVSAVLLPGFSGNSSDTAFPPKTELSSKGITIDFGNKTKRSGEITISNSGKSALKISSLQMFTSGMKVTLGKREIAPSEQTKLKVTCEKELLMKARSKPRVLMITNDPAMPKITININCK